MVYTPGYTRVVHRVVYTPGYTRVVHRVVYTPGYTSHTYGCTIGYTSHTHGCTLGYTPLIPQGVPWWVYTAHTSGCTMVGVLCAEFSPFLGSNEAQSSHRSSGKKRSNEVQSSHRSLGESGVTRRRELSRSSPVSLLVEQSVCLSTPCFFGEKPLRKQAFLLP